MRSRLSPSRRRGGERVRWRVLLAGVLSFACLLAVAEGVVYYDSPCPVPTPYPPSGAPWGVVNNPGFENGFIGGAANQWVSWKDPGYAAPVHAIGTEHVTDGAYSQKLVLPAPGNDYQGAGLYQQLYVVPGGTYTVTVRIYLQLAHESYSGEDLVAQLGVDPYGQAAPGGSGMIWTDEAADKNVWITKTLTATAQLPVMTVSLKATRKWIQHDYTAQVWFDQVTITGPIPTDPPPGPEPDPVDPETLIPATTGANLVANAGFEQAFTGGVSAGWNKWSTLGTGAWQQSLRIGKVGGGKYDCGGEDAMVQMCPKTILLFGGDPENAADAGTYGTVEYFNQFEHLDDTIIIGRPSIDEHMAEYLTDPVYYGRRLADLLSHTQRSYPRIDCWQGLNEPDWGDTFPIVLAFEKAFADRLHELGMKSCSLNLSVGSPGNLWKMIAPAVPGYPSCPDLMQVADYLGHHCYGGPDDDLMVTNQVHDNVCDYAMRPRRFKDMYDRRGWRLPPVIATEGSTVGGSTDAWGDARMGADLTTMGDFMNFNRWWCGYTNFVVGGSCGWGGFEIADHPAILAAVQDWNTNHPSDAVDGLYSQVFGSGAVHPKTIAELTPDGDFDGGVNRQVSGLVPGESYLFACWMKYAFRGAQPASLRFLLGVDPTGQTTDGNATTINWGADQIPDKVPVHEIFSHTWRAFTATSATASIWLRASQTVTNPSFRVYVDQVELRQLTGTAPPLLAVNPPDLTVASIQGTNPPDQRFTVANGGLGMVNYTISEDASWLSVTPDGGTSTGEVDVIAVQYQTSALAPGTYAATITVSDPAVTNCPRAIRVTLTVSPPPFAPADFDRDRDVDLTDFSLFRVCFNGPNRPPGDRCPTNADFDHDGDVDLRDFAVFRSCFNGSNRPPACP